MAPTWGRKKGKDMKRDEAASDKAERERAAAAETRREEERQKAEARKEAAEAKAKAEEKAKRKAEKEAAAAAEAAEAHKRKEAAEHADVADVKKALDAQNEWAAQLDTDLADLPVDPNVYAVGKYSDDVYEAYATLSEFSRKLRSERAFRTPEFVFVGPAGSGKTRVIEVLLGHQLMQEATKRPIEYHVLTNTSLDANVITILADTVTGQEDSVVEVANLPAELSKLNVESAVPLSVKLEGPRFLNSTFIDTPGTPGLGEDWNPVYQDAVKRMVKDDARKVIFVSPSCADWSHAGRIQTLADELDPNWYRTTFVFTKFHFVLKTLQNKGDMNSYVSERPPEKVKTFFISTPSEAALDEAGVDGFQDLVAKSETRDIQEIDERMGASFRTVSDFVGLTALRTFILGSIYKRYADGVPELQKQLRLQAKLHESKIEAIQSQISTLTQNMLRTSASNWSSLYLQQMTDILGSDYGASPHAHGSTSHEEYHAYPSWTDGATGKPLFEGYADFKSVVENADAKLYGGHQLVRLLSTFRSLVDKVSVKALDAEEIANARGMSGAGLFAKTQDSDQGLFWAASDLARELLHTHMNSLLHQLFDRLVPMMRNMSRTVEQILEATADANKHSGSFADRTTSTSALSSLMRTPRGGGAQGIALNMDEFPRFWWFVRELWETYVEEQADICKEKCLDEIACTKFLVWDEADFADVATEDFAGSVEQLTQRLFSQHRDRIVNNVLLKVHEMLLVNIQRDCSGVIQGSINILSDDDMSNLFSIDATRKRLQGNMDKLQGQVDVSAEPKLMTAAGRFRV
jgi:Dynamin family